MLKFAAISDIVKLEGLRYHIDQQGERTKIASSQESDIPTMLIPFHQYLCFLSDCNRYATMNDERIYNMRYVQHVLCAHMRFASKQGTQKGSTDNDHDLSDDDDVIVTMLGEHRPTFLFFAKEAFR